MRNWRQDEFLTRPYAHRGLFNKTDRPENSLAAFEFAALQGYAIELDVQCTLDQKLVVFHDMTLKRMTGEEGVLSETSWTKLKEMQLLKSEQKIPQLEEVLEVIDGRVPLLIEIKPDQLPQIVVPILRNVLRDYTGPYLIESFNTSIVKEYRRYENHVWVGLLSKKYPDLLGRMYLSSLIWAFIYKPDFIAYDVNSPNRPMLWLWRHLLNRRAIGWTVRSEAQYRSTKNAFDAIIFENIRP